MKFPSENPILIGDLSFCCFPGRSCGNLEKNSSEVRSLSFATAYSWLHREQEPPLCEIKSKRRQHNQRPALAIAGIVVFIIF